MNRRTALALCCSGLLSVAAFAGDEPKVEQTTPACCAKKDAKAAAERVGKLRCSLTGKKVDKCCCEQREGGKLHCTLAKRDVDKCCCSEIKFEGKAAKQP